MSADKTRLINALKDCALLMEINGENPFRCRAYEQGARVLEGLEGEPADWLREGLLATTPGIGKGLAEKIEAWVATGRLEQLEALRETTPPGLLELLNIPGLGPKKIKALWESRGIDSLDKLEAACLEGSLDTLAGFGAKSVEKILAGIEQRRRYSERHYVDEATEAAEAILARLRPLKEIGRVDLAGSLRRARETIKDLDLVATSTAPKKVMQTFIETPGVASIIAHGETKSSILLDSGIPIDLRVVEPGQFASALSYFTGSKEHNTALRGRAKRMGFKLNEYGLFPEGEGAEPLPAADEAELYKHLGLAFIPPELREASGEIEAAEKGTLPDLICQAQMLGVLHCHTHYSDGKCSVQEMAQASLDAGYSYLCICDHSKSAAYANGLSEIDIERQGREIDKVAKTLKGFKIFKGIESDILADGSLDYDDATLKCFDMVVASIHSRMNMDPETMTDRICRALEHPATTILGHPTGRLLLRREPYPLDLDRVFETAARHGVVIEINAHPWRLDLDWTQIRHAKKLGCRFAINPDAHDMAGIGHIRYGVGIARKGWLEPADVINTLSAKAFAAWLKERRE